MSLTTKRKASSSTVASYGESTNKRMKRSNSNGNSKMNTLSMGYTDGDDSSNLSQNESLSQGFGALSPVRKDHSNGSLNMSNGDISSEITQNRSMYFSSMEFEEEKSQTFASQDPSESQHQQQHYVPAPVKSPPARTTTTEQQQAAPPSSKQQQERRQRIKENELKAEKLAEEEKEKLLKRQMGDEDFNRELYNHFNKLQTVATEYKISLKLPELVVVGMQSDGKSSFVEALLGFQFNHVDTNIGTRRPLMLSMFHDPSKEKPHCVFQNEDKTVEKPTPVHQLEYEIKKRTEQVCGKDGVSPVPICLHVHYKYCANLVIIDTPGFRKGDEDPLSEKIEKMVVNLLKPKERIIVCLEQSTVEWCNTQVRPMIQRVDPNLSRTVFVCTKFNNRNNQFRDREEVNKFLSTDGQIRDPKNVFFISLPSGHDARDLSEEEFKERILEVYLQDFKHLSRIGFDEKYKTQLGFFNLRRHLEHLLNDRYKSALAPVLERIEHQIQKRQVYIEKLENDLIEAQSADVEEQANQLLNNFVNLVSKCLNGTNMFPTQKYGQTLEEEREKAAGIAWPNYSLDLKIRNSQYKLYGGAQLERLLAEFEMVAHSQEFPQTSDDEVAVTIGLNSLHTIPDYDRGASELAQKKSKMVFQPLIDILLSRSKNIMRNMIVMICGYLFNETGKKQFKKILQELRVASDQFLEKVLSDVKEKCEMEFDTFTRMMDWDLMSFGPSKQLAEYDLLNPTKEDTLKRVQNLTDDSCAEKMLLFTNDRSRELTEERCKKIKEAAARLFGGVRLLFVKYVRAKYLSFFLQPIFAKLDEHCRGHFKKLGSDKVIELCEGPNPIQIQKQMEQRKQEIDSLVEHRDAFVKLYEKFKTLPANNGRSSVTPTKSSSSKANGVTPSSRKSNGNMAMSP